MSDEGMKTIRMVLLKAVAEAAHLLQDSIDAQKEGRDRVAQLKLTLVVNKLVTVVGTMAAYDAEVAGCTPEEVKSVLGDL